MVLDYRPFRAPPSHNFFAAVVLKSHKEHYLMYYSLMVYVNVSNGELLDKFSILQVKMNEIANTNQQLNISGELEVLMASASDLLKNPNVDECYQELNITNKLIWVQMEYIFANRDNKDSLAYQNAIESSIDLNIRRSELKRKINSITQSEVTEEKSYFHGK